MLNMFRVLIHPSSGACDLCVELFRGFKNLYSLQINVTHEITRHTSRKLLRMDVLTSETCWALYKEIIKQVTSSWSLFTQLYIHTYNHTRTRRKVYLEKLIVAHAVLLDAVLGQVNPSHTPHVSFRPVLISSTLPSPKCHCSISLYFCAACVLMLIRSHVDWLMGNGVHCGSDVTVLIPL